MRAARHYAGGSTLVLSRRAIRLPISVRHAPLRRRVMRVVEQLSRGEEAPAYAAAHGLAVDARAADATARAGGGDRAELEEWAQVSLAAAALARVLVDLALAGWELSLDGGVVFALAPPYEGASAGSVGEIQAVKQGVQRALGARVREQVALPSTARLVDEVEGPDGRAALRALASGPRLAASLRRHGASAVQPRLETARRADGADGETGVDRYALFRYLRFHWSFPYGDTPGRSLPLLIRDDGQEGSPVCGLLCLSSPVLRLTARDDALGLTPAWLEAMALGLDLPARVPPAERRRALLAHVESLLGAVRAMAAEGGPSAEQVLEDLGALLDHPRPSSTRALARSLAEAPEGEAERLAEDAARRILQDLLDEVWSAVASVRLDGLGWTLDELRTRPAQASRELAARGAEARESWLNARSEEATARRGVHGVNDEIRALRKQSNELLFDKKRATQLADHLSAWDALAPVREALRPGAPACAVIHALREQTAGRIERRPPSAYRRGALVSRALSEAITLRKVRIAASQIADVSLCGALPPYNVLLGGKLAALLALSAESAAAWGGAYAGAVSEIQSRMAGEDVVRPTDLLALTTTSFYEVGSAQYSRLRLPDALGGRAWHEVGRSRGNGTLHISREASLLMSELMLATTGRQLITSTFGEGPSERMRKLRDGLTLLGLPADDLLQHGMPRLVFTSPISPLTRPGIRSPRADPAPSVAAITSFWADRWLGPRLTAVLASGELDRHDPRSTLLSTRFPNELAAARGSHDLDAPGREVS